MVAIVPGAHWPRPVPACGSHQGARLGAQLCHGAAAASVLLSMPFANAAQAALPAPAQPPQIQACQPSTQCVSTASFQSPSQYLPPWSYTPSTREQAFRAVSIALRAGGGAITTEDEAAGYIAAVVPFGTLGLKDEVEVVVRDDGVALFRSQVQGGGARLPTGPFCLARGCINGPGNRERLVALRQELGWVPLEAEEEEGERRWVQLLLH